MSYDVPSPRRERGPWPADEQHEGYGGREPAYEDLYGRGRDRDPGHGSPRPASVYREPDDGNRRPSDDYQRAWPRPEDRQGYRPAVNGTRPAGWRARSAGRQFTGRGLAELAGAVALAVVSVAVTWVVASRHYEQDGSAGSQQGSSFGVAAPETAAGALSAADTYFALYGAGQYAAVYPLIAPGDRAAIPESVWAGLHQACPVSGLTYKVQTPVLSGTTAVMAVGYLGAAGSLGSEQVTFTYSGGRWYYMPSDVSTYRGHDLAQAVAAAKAAGLCA